MAQDMMGKNQRSIVEKYGKENDALTMMHCLPCVTEAECQGAKEATILHLKIWVISCRDDLN